jgi:hypothetical protein
MLAQPTRNLDKDRSVSERSYEDGVQDAEIKALAKTVSELASDVKKLQIAIWMLYGAIALVNFLPELRNFLG